MTDKLSISDRVSLVKCFYKNGESATSALRAFNKIHKRKGNVCTKAAVINLVKKFEEKGSVQDKYRSGRPRISDEKINLVAETANEMKSTAHLGVVSCSKIANVTQMPLSSTRKILREYLQWRPYRLHTVQYLKETDYELRIEFAKKMKEKLSDSQFISNVLWTDEANFTLDGCVSTHQCVIWAPVNPHTIIQKQVRSKSLSVWVGFTSNFLIGPFFFDSTVTSQSYLSMLEEYVIPTLKRKRKLKKTIFQQDGAPPHVATKVKNFLSKTFSEDRIISRQFPFSWPPRSPDLAPNDYWLWGMVKNKVYAACPHTIDELKSAIKNTIQNIQTDELKTAVDNFNVRLDAVIEFDGGHFEHLV